MAVLAAPVSHETGWSQQWIYGALSLAILISGLLAPLSGRIIARTGGRAMLAASGAVIAAGLTLIGLSHALWLFCWRGRLLASGWRWGCTMRCSPRSACCTAEPRAAPLPALH